MRRWLGELFPIPYDRKTSCIYVCIVQFDFRCAAGLITAPLPWHLSEDLQVNHFTARSARDPQEPESIDSVGPWWVLFICPWKLWNMNIGVAHSVTVHTADPSFWSDKALDVWRKVTLSVSFTSAMGTRLTRKWPCQVPVNCTSESKVLPEWLIPTILRECRTCRSDCGLPSFASGKLLPVLMTAKLPAWVMGARAIWQAWGSTHLSSRDARIILRLQPKVWSVHGGSR